MLLVVLLAVRCGQDGGSLEPVDGRSIWWGGKMGSAVLRDGTVSATLTASWAAEASQGADIVYRNEGAAPVSVILSRLALHHERLGKAPLWTAVDMTYVDRDDTRTDNDEPPILYDLGTSSPTTRLVLKPGEQRRLNLGFTNFPGIERIAWGDRVTATVPLGARDESVEMVAH
ncbi:hypothetical protein ACBY01_15035 [Sphingomonas sp. ac-8]|uniref:hypothetical protein n=1 Tax=Sphingomonas sp. ac-8 TaxID=3242977 RepID=UPI003A7F9A55